MKLFNRKRDWPRGTAQVLSTTVEEQGPANQVLTLGLLVRIPGAEPFETERRFFVKAYRQIEPGHLLPVRVDPADPGNWEVVWKDAGAVLERVDGQPAVSEGDPVAQLERLAKLHADGVIDDEELESLKARILDQAPE